mmetsp:Transcript_21823/g.62111  ORF Transcript_21823/g.62111 Transcript_21823/m.62111 type:complete len:128 (-) Transcript_21823:179-562(-)
MRIHTIHSSSTHSLTHTTTDCIYTDKRNKTKQNQYKTQNRQTDRRSVHSQWTHALTNKENPLCSLSLSLGSHLTPPPDKTRLLCIARLYTACCMIRRGAGTARHSRHGQTDRQDRHRKRRIHTWMGG